MRIVQATLFNDGTFLIGRLHADDFLQTLFNTNLFLYDYLDDTERTYKIKSQPSDK